MSSALHLDAFPNARAFTAPAVVPDARTQLTPDLMAFWNAIFPGQIPERPIVPEALDGDVIDLEGHELRVITVGQSDTAPSTIVSIADLDAVISGDVAYCEHEGIGFIPWFPMATGRLAKPGGALQRIAGELSVTPAQLALAWLLQRSPVLLPIPGTSSVAHLEETWAQP